MVLDKARDPSLRLWLRTRSSQIIRDSKTTRWVMGALIIPRKITLIRERNFIYQEEFMEHISSIHS